MLPLQSPHGYFTTENVQAGQRDLTDYNQHGFLHDGFQENKQTEVFATNPPPLR